MVIHGKANRYFSQNAQWDSNTIISYTGIVKSVYKMFTGITSVHVRTSTLNTTALIWNLFCRHLLAQHCIFSLDCPATLLAY